MNCYLVVYEKTQEYYAGPYTSVSSCKAVITRHDSKDDLIIIKFNVSTYYKYENKELVELKNYNTIYGD